MAKTCTESLSWGACSSKLQSWSSVDPRSLSCAELVTLTCWRHLNISQRPIWRGENAFSSFILKPNRSLLLILTSVLGGSRMKTLFKGSAQLSLPQPKSSSVCPLRKDPPCRVKITAFLIYPWHLHCHSQPWQGSVIDGTDLLNPSDNAEQRHEPVPKIKMVLTDSEAVKFAGWEEYGVKSRADLAIEESSSLS